MEGNLDGFLELYAPCFKKYNQFVCVHEGQIVIGFDKFNLGTTVSKLPIHLLRGIL